MADLTAEQFEQVPDFLKDDYTEVDGVFKHAGMLKVKQTANDLDSKLKAQGSEFASLSDRLTAFEQKEADSIKAKTEKELENAKSKGDIDTVLKQHSEQMADLEKRTAEKVRAETLSEVGKERAEEKAKSAAKEIAAKLAIDGAEEDLNLLVSRRIKPDEQGNIIYLNSDGSASAMDKAAFLDDVKIKHKYLVKGETTTKGGGFSNGNTGNGGSAVKVNAKAEEAKSKRDGVGHLNAHFSAHFNR